MEENKASSYAFGFIMLCLPAGVLEDERLHLKHTLVVALMDTTLHVVREAATTAIIAAQVVLHDGLADDKKNLLMYLFDKQGIRGMTGSGSVDCLE